MSTTKTLSMSILLDDMLLRYFISCALALSTLPGGLGGPVLGRLIGFDRGLARAAPDSARRNTTETGNTPAFSVIQ